MMFKKRVLKKLYFERMIGGKHTSVEAIKRGFPSHEKAHVDKAIKKLVKADLLEQPSYKLWSSIFIESQKNPRN